MREHTERDGQTKVFNIQTFYEPSGEDLGGGVLDARAGL